jgi:hypothetical protein
MYFKCKNRHLGGFKMWPRQESNLDLELRKLLYYPLYYEAVQGLQSYHFFAVSNNGFYIYFFLLYSAELVTEKRYAQQFTNLGRMAA